MCQAKNLLRVANIDITCDICHASVQGGDVPHQEDDVPHQEDDALYHWDKIYYSTRSSSHHHPVRKSYVIGNKNIEHHPSTYHS